MVINHVDNRSLYYHTINRESNKLLIDKMHECFHLLQQIQDKDISGKLYLAISDAVDIAEDHAFDVGAALQAAITKTEYPKIKWAWEQAAADSKESQNKEKKESKE